MLSNLTFRQTENFRNIIVIGTSAGGISALTQLVSGLPENIDAAVVAVMHLSQKSSAQNITDILSRNTELHCNVVADRMPLSKGHFYLAPENHHILVNDSVLNVSNGPREHRYRPSIDVLFRSVAVIYRSRAVGVVLTGMLDDGTSGMYAIKKCGGICIVQEPAEAEYNGMPLSVVERVPVDYQVPLEKIPDVLMDVLSKPLPPEIPVPEDLRIESEITQKLMTSINEIKEIGNRTDFICPDCGGGLWAIKDDPTHRYRCHTGHVYTEKALYDIQGVNLEESLWVSIRMLEERKNIIESMLRHAESRNTSELSINYRENLQEIEKHIKSLKYILLRLVNESEQSEMRS